MGKRQKSRRDSEKARPRVGLQRVAGQGDAWELVLPPTAAERTDDLEEVRAMIEAGELEVALDELRWLLEGCGDLIEAHQLLGEIALEQGDVPLARAHFGYAVRIVQKALPPNFRGTLPAERPANRAFYEAAIGLVDCLQRLDKRGLADDVVKQLKQLDPSDTLQIVREPPPGCAGSDGPDVYELR